MKALVSYLSAVFLLIGLAGCEKEKITENIHQLSFSRDAVIFDTVFTQIGTATRNFKVYNKGKGTLRISSVYLANPDSPFRINVDGLSGREFKDVEILANDSIFVFVEATINPNGANSPLIASDSIVFNINGSTRDVDLVAWGQDANYIVADTYYENLPPLKILPPNSYWSNNKPYVIYGYAVIDSGNTLTIQEGTRVHFHSGSGLWVYKDGNLKVNGSRDKPVVFQGDRLEPWYRDVAGQWDRIWINEGSKDNVISYAIIKNGLIGLQAETAPFINNINAPTSANKLIIKNTIIQNHSGMGIYARNYKITAENVVVANTGQYGVAISGGGEYNFTHSTVANYNTQGQRSTTAFYMTNVYEAQPDEFQVRRITNNRFTNCIFYGMQENELDYDIDNDVPCTFSFENCLVKRKDPINSPSMVNIIYNQDPQFKDRSNFDWHLQPNSAARDKGKSTSVLFDIEGNPRVDLPDIGSYEFIP